MRTALLCLLLTACATPNWTHPTKGEDQRRADQYECDRDSFVASNLAQLGLIRQCMEARGWRVER